MINQSPWQRWLLYSAVGLSAYYLLLDVSSSLIGIVGYQVISVGGVLLLLWLSWRHRQSLPSQINYLWRLGQHEWPLVTFAAVCVVSLAATVCFSWIMTPLGLRIQGGNLHDSAWHLALIKSLQRSVPPLQPASFENTVTNYHYYYDLGTAAVASSTLIAPSVLHFQVFPILISAYLALTTIGFARSITGRKWTAYWLLFFVFFGGNAGYLIPLAFPTKPWMESTFWVSQTFSMMINPQLLISFALLLVLLSTPLWGNLLKSKRLFAMILVITASLAGIKMYAFLIACALLGSYLLFKLSRSTVRSVAIRMVLLILVFCVMFLRFTNPAKQGLIYSPLWFVNTMVEAPDRLFVIDWKLREDTYRAEGSVVHLLALKIKEVVIFYGGNLGTRAIFLALPFLFLWQRKHRLVYPPGQGYQIGVATTGFLISTTVPLFFIQSGLVWNTIQFWYYGLLFASILAALTMGELAHSLSKQRLTYGLVVLIIVIATVPAWWQTVALKMSTADLISNDILVVAAQLRPNEKIMICPTGPSVDFTFKSSLIGALSTAQVYLVDPVQLELLGQDGYARERQYLTDFRSPSQLREILQQKQITSVICADEAWSTQMATIMTDLSVRVYQL